MRAVPRAIYEPSIGPISTFGKDATKFPAYFPREQFETVLLRKKFKFGAQKTRQRIVTPNRPPSE